MREVITFVAYDGKEFDIKQDCLDYEFNVFQKIESYFNSHIFYDKDMDELKYIFPTVEKGFSCLSDAFSKCSYIRVADKINKETHDLIYYELGYVMPEDDSEELGLFKYSFDEYKWVKVDE